ncbi:hypothetical protein L249_5384, partial [Ophiocordyceps polyrhachis-furcata BCC 54312]
MPPLRALGSPSKEGLFLACIIEVSSEKIQLDQNVAGFSTYLLAYSSLRDQCFLGVIRGIVDIQCLFEEEGSYEGLRETRRAKWSWAELFSTH